MENLAKLSRKALIDQLEGTRVALVDVYKAPEGKKEGLLQALDEMIGKPEWNDYTACFVEVSFGTFKGTSSGYKRGESRHFWEKSDYCLTNNDNTYLVVTSQGYTVMILFKQRKEGK